MLNFKLVKIANRIILLKDYNEAGEGASKLPTSSLIIAINPRRLIEVIKPRTKVYFKGVNVKGAGLEARYYVQKDMTTFSPSFHESTGILHELDDTSKFKTLEHNGYLWINPTIEGTTFRAEAAIKITGHQIKVLPAVRVEPNYCNSSKGIQVKDSGVRIITFRSKSAVKGITKEMIDKL